MKDYTPYIKPTRRVHDSGFRIFEVGYCKIEDVRVVDKKVIGECSDHIRSSPDFLIGKGQPISINMDLTRDGYIRFWSNQGELVWSFEDMALSSMELVLKE